MPLDDRMSGIGCDQIVPGMHHRLRVVQRGRRISQSAQHIEGRECPGRVLNPRRRRRDLGPHRFEQGQLTVGDFLVGPEHLLLVILQRRGDEALAAGDGLLAMVVGRDVGQVRLRDLDVVPEDAVVADLE